MIKSLTKLREEETKKKKLAEELEKLEAIGAPGKRGVREAKKFYQEQEEKGKEKEADELTQLHWEREKRTIVTYNHLLAKLLLKRLLTVDWRNWSYKVSPTTIGVVMEVISPTGRIFRAGFKPTGIPKYDLNAVDTYAIRAENTIDRATMADGAIIKP